nr:MliC family protein [uncultured Halomonas sp.]
MNLRSSNLVVGALLFTSIALAGCVNGGASGSKNSSVSQAGDLQFEQRTYRYTCDNNQVIEARYVTTQKGNEDGPVLLVLHYKDQLFGLAPAVSASGSRYIGHAGLTTGSGLEWWGKGDDAWLSRFTGDNAQETERLQTCRLDKS